jgi:hypothetical protein
MDSVRDSHLETITALSQTMYLFPDSAVLYYTYMTARSYLDSSDGLRELSANKTTCTKSPHYILSLSLYRSFSSGYTPASTLHCYMGIYRCLLLAVNHIRLATFRYDTRPPLALPSTVVLYGAHTLKRSSHLSGHAGTRRILSSAKVWMSCSCRPMAAEP